MLGSSLCAQTNPVPLINNPLSPDAAAPGTLGLTLTVNGTGFVSGATANWNGSPRATAFVSSSRLTAAILTSDLAGAGTFSVTVTNPTPGGGTSNPISFEVTQPTPTAAFANSSTNPVSNASVVVAADLNGDGKLDLVTSNGSSGIAVLLGNGDGTFQSPQTFATGGVFPVSIAFGDFDNDGKLDVVTANFSSGVSSMSILLGNGNGMFQPFQSYPLDSNPTWITVGDFNGDGNLDVGVPICPLGSLPLCGAASTVNILLGNGDGTFQPKVDYPAGPSPTTSVAGDFNGDGHLDLAVAGFADGSFTNGIGILLGNGDGSFKPPSFLSGPYFYLATAVLNQDGLLDLAAVSNSPISILAGKGDGTFRPPVFYTAGHYLVSITIGDFNGDGHMDLAVLDCVETAPVSSAIYVLLGNGDGTFGPPTEIATPQTPGSQLGYLATGDFNGDGRLDLTSVQSNGGGGIYNVVASYLQTNISLNPQALSFPITLVGTDSESQTLTVSNLGATSLSVSKVSLTGANASDFRLGADSCQGAVIPSPGTCEIAVSFLPGAKGPRTAAISLTDSALASPQQALLSSNGTVLNVASASLNFGSVKVGTISAPQIIPPANTSASGVQITSISFTGSDPGDFVRSSSCGTGALAAGTSCSIVVEFLPKASGSRTATVSITANDGSGPHQVVFTGTGASVEPPTVLGLTPNSGTGVKQTFSAAFSDPNGVADLSAVLLLVNTSLKVADSCAIIYVPGTNQMHLYNDAGTGLSAGITPGSTAQASNSQCTLTGAGSSFSTSGDKLTLNAALDFTGYFVGQNYVILYAVGNTANSGFKLEGVWTP